LGVRLFDCSKRKIALIEAGKMFFRARQIIGSSVIRTSFCKKKIHMRQDLLGFHDKQVVGQDVPVLFKLFVRQPHIIFGECCLARIASQEKKDQAVMAQRQSCAEG
jgi:hypothetical protein